MKNVCKVIVLALLLSLPNRLLFSINIKLLKGTHDILQGEDTYYAPFWGLVFIEEGIAEDLYDLSPKQIVSSLKDTFASLKGDDDFKDKKIALLRRVGDIKNTGTQNLIESLFHKVGGTFNVTVLKENPVSFLNAEDIGFLLQKIKMRSFYRNLISDKLTKKAKITDEEYQNLLRAFNVADSGAKTFNSFSTNRLVFIDRIFDECLKVKLLKDPALSKAWNQFVSSVKISLEECDSKNKEALYPQYTTQGILLGYMLQKIATKGELEEYFSSFLGRAVVLPGVEYSLQEMNELADKPVDFKSIPEFADFICSSIYLKNYDAALPKIAINKKVFYESVDFTDCVENALRMICNIVTYDQSKKTFGNNVPLSELLTSFYGVPLHSDASEVANIAVHQAWMELLENIPGVKYAKLKLKDDTHYFDSAIDEFNGEEFAGFIPMVDIDASLPKKNISIGKRVFTCYKKVIGQETFLLVPHGSELHCFEVHAFLSNIVFLLDYLFELHVVLNSSDIFSDNFVSRYFLPIFKKLGLSTDSDEWKYKDFLIDISIYKGRNQFVLQLKSIHAEVFVPSTKKIMPSYIGKDLYASYPTQIAALVSLYGVDINRLYDLVGSNLVALSQLIPFVDVRSNTAKLFMINDILDKKITSLGNFTEAMLLTLLNVSDQKTALDELFAQIQIASDLKLVKGFIPSYISMIHIMKIQSSKHEKQLSLYESFLQLLLVQKDDTFQEFIRNLEIALGSDFVDDVKKGLFIAKLALQRNLISSDKIPLFMKPIVFCLANKDSQIFEDTASILFAIVKSGAVAQVNMVRFMLGFAKHCVQNLNDTAPGINILSLLIRFGVIRDSDLIASFDTVKVNKNKSLKASGLVKIIDTSLGRLSSSPVRTKTVVEEIVD